MAFLEEFNDIVPDAFRPGTVLALMGPPASGKTAFGVTAAAELLKNGRPCVFFTTELAPEDVMKRVPPGLNVDFQSAVDKKLLYFVDCYSWRLGLTHNRHPIGDPSALSDIGTLVQRMLAQAKADHPGAPPVVVFDSVSSLFLYNEAPSVLKFMQVQVARFRDAKATALLSLEEGVTPPELVQTIGFFVDGIFRLRVEQQFGTLRRALQVFSMRTGAHRTDWVDFDVGAGGFRFLEKKLKIGRADEDKG